MSGNEEAGKDDFAALMAGTKEVKAKQFEPRASDVVVLAAEPAKVPAQSTLQLDKGKLAQRNAALGEAHSNLDSLKALAPDRHAPQDIIEFKQVGLQNGVYKKLRTGRYDVEAKLDLHGLNVDQALNATLQFINSSMSEQKRCVIISHGKGIKQNEPARLKNHLSVWLKNMPEIMAYHSALPNQGGTGCIYVLLKKSEQKKQENRERFANVKKGKS